MPERRTLSSWKEIATHLGVTVRTAQRWERERGMPVRRIPGARAGQVFAAVEEIETWRTAVPDVGVVTAEPRTSPDEGARPGGRRRHAEVAVLGAVVVGVFGLVAWRLGARTQHVDTLRISERSVVALDRGGRELWSASFPSPLNASAYAGQALRAIADLDADGRSEVVFAEVHRYPDRGALICYNDDGSVRWRFAPSGRVVRTRTEEFADVFYIRDFAVLERTEGQAASVVVTSTQEPYYPTQIVRLSPAGRVLTEYWHSGRLDRLAVRDVNGDGSADVVASGVSNSWKAATVVALDPHRISGASDETEHLDYQLIGLGRGTELARVLFPRSCLSKPRSPFSVVANMVPERDRIQVHTLETDNPSTSLIWFLGSDLRPLDVGASSWFEQLHKQAELTGEIDHSLSPDELRRMLADVRVVPAVNGAVR